MYAIETQSHTLLLSIHTHKTLDLERVMPVHLLAAKQIVCFLLEQAFTERALNHPIDEERPLAFIRKREREKERERERQEAWKRLDSCLVYIKYYGEQG